MEKIKAELSSNYCDRNINGNYLDINYDPEVGLWFNFPLSDKEDDYGTINVRLSDLMWAIGKEIENLGED